MMALGRAFMVNESLLSYIESSSRHALLSFASKSKV